MPTVSPADREAMIAFINETYDFVKHMCLEGTDPHGRQLIHPELKTDFADAWKEFDEQFDLQDAARRIRTADADRLVACGLFGTQLKLKLRIKDRLKDIWDKVGGSTILKKLIDALDNLLDSILAATGIDEALKELKDSVSGAID